MDRQREVGRTKHTGFQVGARRTFEVPPERAWRFLTSRAGAEVWLGRGAPRRFVSGEPYELDDGVEGVVRVVSPGSHLRLSWQPSGWPRPSTLQVRVIPKGERATVAFHQEHLPGPAERAQRLAHFRATLDALGQALGEPRPRGTSGRRPGPP